MNVRKARAIIAIGANTKDLDKEIEASRKKLRSFMQGAKSFAGKTFGKAFGGAKAMGGALLGGFGIEAAGGLIGTVEGVMDVERALTRFQISTKTSVEGMASMRAELKRISNATGVSRAELVKGAAAYASFTGKGDEAREAMQLFAEVAIGSNVAIEDVAATAATMKKNLNIDPKNFRAAFDILIAQGEMASFEIKDLASQMAKVTPQFSQFAGGKSVEGLSELGAMLQVAIDGFGSAEEAATGFNGLMTQITKNQKKLKSKFKLDVIDAKSGKMRNLLDIVRDISTNKALLEQGALFDALGEEKAVRAVTMLKDKLQQVENIKAKSLNSDQTAKNNLMWQQSAAGKLARAFESAKNAVADIFTPERIEMFVSGIARGLEKVIALIDRIDAFINKENIERENAIRDRRVAFYKRTTTDTEGRTAEEMESMALLKVTQEDQLRERLKAQLAGTNWIEAGDTAKYGKVDRTKVYSAEELRGLATVLASGSDWQTNLPLLMSAFTKAMKESPINVTVNLDGAKAGDKIDNSPRVLKPRPPR